MTTRLGGDGLDPVAGGTDGVKPLDPNLALAQMAALAGLPGSGTLGGLGTKTLGGPVAIEALRQSGTRSETVRSCAGRRI